jgi:hypothetical protein
MAAKLIERARLVARTFGSLGRIAGVKPQLRLIEGGNATLDAVGWSDPKE